MTTLVRTATQAEFTAGADDTIVVSPASVPAAVRGAEEAFTTTLKTKLDSVEADADVTDATNVAAAGAAMTANNLSDLGNAGAARANLGVAVNSDVQAWNTNLDTLSGITPGATGLAVIADVSAADVRAEIDAAGTSVTNTFSAAQTFDAALNLTNGAAAAPALTFTNDPDTGVFRNGANELGMAAGGEMKFRIRGLDGTSWHYLDADTDGSRIEIQKTASPASYSSTAAGLVVQVEDTQDRTSAINGCGMIAISTISGDGKTNGSSSGTTWHTTRSSMIKNGDGSGAPFGATNTLGPVTTHDSGTAQAGSASSITLKATASSNDDEYNGKIVTITGGTGLGQIATISDYDGTSKVASVPGGSFDPAPDNTSTYTVTGYNELGGLSMVSTNVGSTNGIMSGVEVLLRDSGDSGATDWDTEMHVLVPRIARFHEGSASVAFMYCSAEGEKDADAIIKLNQSPLSHRSVKKGLDFRGWSFSDGHVAAFPIDTKLAWENTAGNLVDAIQVNGSNQLVLKPAGASAAIVLQDGGAASRIRVDSGGVEIRPSGLSALAEVSVGANDSGGTGYRVLRIPN